MTDELTPIFEKLENAGLIERTGEMQWGELSCEWQPELPQVHPGLADRYVGRRRCPFRDVLWRNAVRSWSNGRSCRGVARRHRRVGFKPQHRERSGKCNGGG
jgi:hypothetical protein